MTYNPDVHRQFSDFFENKTLSPFLYLLSKRFSDGHICLDLNEINPKELKEGDFKNADLNALKNVDLVGTEEDYQPFILWKNKLYMQRYFHYETTVYQRILELIQNEKGKQSEIESKLKSLNGDIATLFPPDTLEKPDWQMVAALSAVFNQFNIITGGPGTGKTTTVAKILVLLLRLDSNLKVALAAPTGKAAARMAESLKETAQKDTMNINADTKEVFKNLEPSTIHRLLGARPNQIYFKHNKDNTIPHDLIIVDESSMIDVALFSKLMDAIKPSAKVIFLGDKDQLASVEAGSLFGDLCTAQGKLNFFSPERAQFINSLMPDGKTPLSEGNIQENNHPLFQHIIELQHSYRFAAGGNIGVFSRAIIDNDVSSIESFFDNHAPDIALDFDYDDKILTTFAKGYHDYIQESDTKLALQKLNQLRVLCATREGEQGVYKTNQNIERYLQSKNLISITGTFYEHRPVMVTGNNYELGLFNGDIGIVRKDETGKLRVYFEDADGNLRGIQPAFVTASETVFAMTIHKSQGSEFDDVLVRLPDYGENAILTRELLYTAVTRAKKNVILQGNKEVILETCQRRVKRGSGIAERFEA
ncbi:exodeoxyribonuclease V subunit alpha [Aequorivita sp. H23M31]|uniref:RecBCD enzyme subunit RecD n=1 Tax=Aequorivita ciconiae TaxID=2494375 RepID=A0A410G0D1_9FLAO|nr:exodeoxyribonuclease V subunit alpha [Aequorivita sp. H23M31]QAA80726.1 exodeoxyribonuclease V subunit alpha [Aequorivita sp. H23M31]